MKKLYYTLLLLIMNINNNAYADSLHKDNFQNPAQWSYISDNVMGGKSKGSVYYDMGQGSSIAYLSGNVTTKNNGGFIQIRKNLKDINLKDAEYVKITAKGNNQKYFVHFRTSGTILPWQYYQLSFTVTKEYKEFILPISEFKKSGSFQASKINPKNITSIGLVAFGRDHEAKLYVKEVNFYGKEK